MIDTIKIFTMIDKKIYDIISNYSIIKTSFHSGTGELFYKIVNDKLEGSYSSSLSVRVGEGAKYKFVNMYYLEIEGSYHKIVRGYNSHNGFYNFISVCKELIKLVENFYNINLPYFNHWFLQRCDIAICYDLHENHNVKFYINNLSHCNYPRRNIKHYQDESIYCSGTSTTLKIYNKMLEFKKHDLKKIKSTDFDFLNYLHKIRGFIRFECEIKKQKLKSIYNKNYIRLNLVSYNDLKKIWECEFMKFLKIFEKDLKFINNKNEVEQRLFSLYNSNKANILYNFYNSILVDGLDNVKKRTSRSTFYRNISELKKCGIDFSQTLNIDFDKQFIDFNPFTYKEVA